MIYNRWIQKCSAKHTVLYKNGNVYHGMSRRCPRPDLGFLETYITVNHGNFVMCMACTVPSVHSAGHNLSAGGVEVTVGLESHSNVGGNWHRAFRNKLIL